MPSKPPPIFPSERKLLIALGERLRLARLRRRLSAEQGAERSGISRTTLHRAEKGEPGVQMGTYVRILAMLNLDNDLAKLAADDELARRLADIELLNRNTRRIKKGERS